MKRFSFEDDRPTEEEKIDQLVAQLEIDICEYDESLLSLLSEEKARAVAQNLYVFVQDLLEHANEPLIMFKHIMKGFYSVEVQSWGSSRKMTFEVKSNLSDKVKGDFLEEEDEEAVFQRISRKLIELLSEDIEILMERVKAGEVFEDVMYLAVLGKATKLVVNLMAWAIDSNVEGASEFKSLSDIVEVMHKQVVSVAYLTESDYQRTLAVTRDLILSLLFKEAGLYKMKGDKINLAAGFSVSEDDQTWMSQVHCSSVNGYEAQMPDDYLDMKEGEMESMPKGLRDFLQKLFYWMYQGGFLESEASKE